MDVIVLFPRAVARVVVGYKKKQKPGGEPTGPHEDCDRDHMGPGRYLSRLLFIK
ncbi:hypothetical protein V22_42730 [Calycomorphotria hydatis]|uniref:Uncharacterized protein n=1 Tax=Calycomorphotria hydatis TaxID=2528027 RepID=A0A517TF52_9PLAN|nr:hypothetical protein V22_42730 [Calycomorphotria hydatis]